MFNSGRTRVTDHNILLCSLLPEGWKALRAYYSFSFLPEVTLRDGSFMSQPQKSGLLSSIPRPAGSPASPGDLAGSSCQVSRHHLAKFREKAAWQRWPRLFEKRAQRKSATSRMSEPLGRKDAGSRGLGGRAPRPRGRRCAGGGGAGASREAPRAEGPEL